MTLELELHDADNIENFAENFKLFWNCKTYEEYALECDMNGLKKLFDKDNFDACHSHVIDVIC